MQGITPHCRLARLLNSSLSRVCTAGAPRCCQRLAKDLEVACCAPRIGRNFHVLLVRDCQDIMPARADHLRTATDVYTERAQRRRGTTQHFYRPTPVSLWENVDANGSQLLMVDGWSGGVNISQNKLAGARKVATPQLSNSQLARS